jgi:FixJ family two-component response regulator
VSIPFILEVRLTCMANTKPVVYIVDDDISIRESLEAMVAESGFRAEVFGSAEEFLLHTRSSAPSCLILDVNLPQLNGLELQRRLGTHQAALPILFITGYGDIPMTVQAMKAGAIEFMTKPFNPAALRSALSNAVERSRKWIVEDESLKTLTERHETLSRREREVMWRVVRGQLNKQVAGELGISEITVKAHRGKMMRKMQAKSIADLVRMASRLTGSQE